MSDNFIVKCKKRLVDAYGGKCCLCGYDKCIQALSFHHINPKEKLFHISSWEVRNWEKIVDEAKKCVLVCSNCHSEVHYNNKPIPKLDYKVIERLEKIKLEKCKKVPAKQTKCIVCDNMKTSRTDFCSVKCFIKHKSNINFDPVDFINEFQQYGIHYMKKKYKCSDVTIYKYLNSEDIKTKIPLAV